MIIKPVKDELIQCGNIVENLEQDQAKEEKSIESTQDSRQSALPTLFSLAANANIDSGLHFHPATLEATMQSQIQIAHSYLPNVEAYLVWGTYRDLEYVSSSLPSLRTLTMSISFPTANTANIFENISKLAHLENLKIITPISGKGLSLTDQEMKALSKMCGLKKLAIPVNTEKRFEFEQTQLPLLKKLLPNTRIQVDYFLEWDPTF